MFDNTVETDRMLRDVIVQVASHNARGLTWSWRVCWDAEASWPMVITKYDPFENSQMNPNDWGEISKNRKVKRVKSSWMEPWCGWALKPERGLPLPNRLTFVTFPPLILGMQGYGSSDLRDRQIYTVVRLVYISRWRRYEVIASETRVDFWAGFLCS